MRKRVADGNGAEAWNAGIAQELGLSQKAPIERYVDCKECGGKLIEKK